MSSTRATPIAPLVGHPIDTCRERAVDETLIGISVKIISLGKLLQSFLREKKVLKLSQIRSSGYSHIEREEEEDASAYRPSKD